MSLARRADIIIFCGIRSIYWSSLLSLEASTIQDKLFKDDLDDSTYTSMILDA